MAAMSTASPPSGAQTPDPRHSIPPSDKDPYLTALTTMLVSKRSVHVGEVLRGIGDRVAIERAAPALCDALVDRWKKFGFEIKGESLGKAIERMGPLAQPLTDRLVNHLCNRSVSERERIQDCLRGIMASGNPRQIADGISHAADRTFAPGYIETSGRGLWAWNFGQQAAAILKRRMAIPDEDLDPLAADVRREIAVVADTGKDEQRWMAVNVLFALGVAGDAETNWARSLATRGNPPAPGSQMQDAWPLTRPEDLDGTVLVDLTQWATYQVDQGRAQVLERNPVVIEAITAAAMTGRAPWRTTQMTAVEREDVQRWAGRLFERMGKTGDTRGPHT
jgi:hypothetical protein